MGRSVRLNELVRDRVMVYQIATIVLAPVLLWQGKHVRRRTLRLPEAAGPRVGVTGNGVPLRLLVLGDSSAAGVGAATQASGLSGHTVAGLVDRFRVEWQVIAETGMTTRAMISRLKSETPGPFTVAVTALGVNDVTRRRSVFEWIDEQRSLWDLLRTQCGVSLIVVSGLPPVHLFPALPQPLRWYLGVQARRFDRALVDVAQEQGDCQFVSLHGVVDSSAMASDGFHPGEAAYVVWGKRVASTITEFGVRSA